ncbi:Hypothetical predicted protein [Paramuricea clavata]|uniref:Uncharacterized protein n=1 Tax=Paramuricea clavata TaxID=317549 RepID=A0A7D9DRF7_PARCT|nr:Hypothetical predicted protein [Paramuricea clavata]
MWQRRICSLQHPPVLELCENQGNDVSHRATHMSHYLYITEKKDAKSIEQLVHNNPNIKPSEVQSAIILTTVQQQMDWATVEKEAASTIDKKQINEHFRDITFMAVSMDAGGDISSMASTIIVHPDYVMLTASVYHPLLCRQIPLAIMEVEKENTTNIDVAKKPLKFNPIGRCTDMARTNLSGIYKVVGDSVQIKSCEFHFKDHRNNKVKKWDPDSAGELKILCNDLPNNTTENAYIGTN